MEPQVAPAISGLMDPVGTGATLEQGLDFSLGQSLKATAAETFVSNPAMALRDLYEYGADRFVREKDLTAEEANQQYSHIGLSFSRPVSRHYADILAEQKRQETTRGTIDAYGPQGIGASAAKFAVGLGMSALDPINIASSFIPAVGATRLVNMLGPEAAIAIGGLGGNMLERGAIRAATALGADKLGRYGLMAAEGAVGGAIGAVAVEPLVYAGANARQADYSLTDSLLNITFGTILGGGLHVLGGYVGDRFKAEKTKSKIDGGKVPVPETHGDVAATLHPETAEAALRTSIGQAVSGQVVDVSPIIDSAPQKAGQQLVGSTQILHMAQGEPLEVRYNVVEASDLKLPDETSLPRSEDKVAASDLIPERLMESSLARDGAPIVDTDLAATNPNAHTQLANIREAYRNKYAVTEAYKEQLAARGIDTASFKEPVLVRQKVEPSATSRAETTADIRTEAVRDASPAGESPDARTPRAATDPVVSDSIRGDSMASQSRLAEAQQLISTKEAELDADIADLEQMLKGMGELTDAEANSLAEVDGFINNQPTIREAIKAAAACIIGK